MTWRTTVPVTLLALSGFAHADIGEDCSEPLVLSGSLPIMVSGDTTSFNDDYDFGDEEPCAGGGNVNEGTAVGPDAVYAVQPSAFCELTVTLRDLATVYAKPQGEPMVDTFITGVSQDTWIFFPWDMALQYVEPYRGTD